MVTITKVNRSTIKLVQPDAGVALTACVEQGGDEVMISLSDADREVFGCPFKIVDIITLAEELKRMKDAGK